MTTMSISTSRRRGTPTRARCVYAASAAATTSADVGPSTRRTRAAVAARPRPQTTTDGAVGALERGASTQPVANPALHAPAVTLTRRGRLALSCAALVAVVAALGGGLTLLDSGEAAATGSTSGPVLTTITVEPGDTLWDIARDLAPGSDPRDMVSRLRDLNDVSGGLASGQELVVPVSR